VGPDLGQSWTGIIERVTEGTGYWAIDGSRVQREKSRTHFQLRYLHRLPMRKPYTELVDFIIELMGKEPLKGSADLVADQSGVGAPGG
jgi:hypothetical protein